MRSAVKYPVSIIVPVLNEESIIEDQLAHMRRVAPRAQLIVVDGGSSDRTPEISRELADILVTAPQGRASQMNAGVAHAMGEYLLFLHADTGLPEDFEQQYSEWSSSRPYWGYFSLKLTGSSRVYRLIETMINFRTKMTAGVSGDQCQIVRADIFRAMGGFSEVPVMEDLHLSRRLRALIPPKLINSPVLSSNRRWEQNGIIKTIMLMLFLRSVFVLGLSPRYVHKLYGRIS